MVCQQLNLLSGYAAEGHLNSSNHILKPIPSHLRSLHENIVQNPPYSWFPSTPALVEMMLSQINIQPGMLGLDPSAGSGVLAEAMRSKGAIVDVIEVDSRLQTLLFQQGFNLVGDDFLKTEPSKLYDVILMNPPFSSLQQKGVDLEHIQRAYRYFLATSGQLVSVVSASMSCRNCPRAQQFRGFLKRIQANVIALPLEIFWSSERPVTVECSLIVTRKLPLR
jgi:predicted RNA methylase